MLKDWKGCVLQRSGVNQPKKRLVDMIQAKLEVRLERFIKQILCHVVLLKSVNKSLVAQVS